MSTITSKETVSTIRRRDFLKSLGIGSILMSLPYTAQLHAATDKRPNILFFLSDDHRNDILGCAGHPFLQTPTIDRLAAEGVRFRNMFVTTSICAASRASILTGLHEQTHGFTFGTPPVRNEHAHTSYPAVLKSSGYRTGMIGKLGVLFEEGAINRMFDVYMPVDRNPYFHEMPDGTLRHETDLCCDHAIDFIKTNSPDQPFCLSVSFNAPHAEDADHRPGIGHFPWPQSVDGLYEDIEMPPPRLSDPAIFESQPKFLRESLNRERYYWRWDTPEKYQTNMRAYFRMLTGIDKALNRVLKSLEDAGIADNTIIIFTGDNGYYMAERGFTGKWSHYEESLRVPLVIYDPRMPLSLRGRVLEPKALNIDLASTMLDWAGIRIPKHYQGLSLTPLMAGRRVTDWREDFFCEHHMNHPQIPKWEGVRGKRYVYANYFEEEYEFLHDLEADPDQLENFRDNPEYAETLDTMRSRCDDFKTKYKA